MSPDDHVDREGRRCGFGPLSEPRVRQAVHLPTQRATTRNQSARPTTNPTKRPIARATGTRVRKDMNVAPAAVKPTPINAHAIQSGASHESFDRASVTTMRPTVPSHMTTARDTRVCIQPAMDMTIANTLCIPGADRAAKTERHALLATDSSPAPVFANVTRGRTAQQPDESGLTEPRRGLL
jgi:hypothetical protein